MGLRLRGIDVTTVQDDGTVGGSDEDLLERAEALDRVLFSQDQDLLRLAKAWRLEGRRFAGVIFAPQQRVTTGQLVKDLELLAKAGEMDHFENHVEFLPL